MFRLASLLVRGGEGVDTAVCRALDVFVQAAGEGNLEERTRFSDLLDRK